MAHLSRLSLVSILEALWGGGMAALREKGLRDELRAARGSWQSGVMKSVHIS